MQTIWRLLIGLYGADVVKRKFGTEPPDEWTGIVHSLTDYEIQRGTRRLVYNGRRDVPSLPEFVRLCRSSGSSDIDEGPQAPVTRLSYDQGNFDRWDVAANNHLLAHIRRRLGPNHAAYGIRHSHAMERCTQALVKAKNLWAQVMREEAGDSPEVDVETQQTFWKHCIGEAEREIAGITHG